MIGRPLKPQYFQILLALAEEDLHGYGIQRSVLARTDDQMHLWPAMLYRSLGRLEEADLIRPASGPEDEPKDERRQYYALTDAGRERLKSHPCASFGRSSACSRRTSEGGTAPRWRPSSRTCTWSDGREGRARAQDSGSC